jgi:hypothetical protein
VPDATGGAPGSGIANGAGRPPPRRPPLLISGEASSWDWVPEGVTCAGCGCPLDGEGYAGTERDTWSETAPGPVAPVAFCEICALRRAQGSVGTVVVDGESHRCTVRRWERDDPDTLEVALDDIAPTVRRQRDRLVTRLVPVDTFQPERRG